MDTGRQALVFFYALFWATALSVTGRYQPFDTPNMSRGDSKAWRRFFASFVILNVAPALLLYCLYNTIPGSNNAWTIIAAATSSISVFGFHRILHAVIASDKTYHLFYTNEQVKDVRDRKSFEQPQTFLAHFAPGILYIVFFNGLAQLIVMLQAGK